MQAYTADAVREMVEQDYETSQQLLGLLKQETPCIQDKDYDGVKNILKAKAPLLDQLQKHAELRKQWLISLYNIADEKHWQELLESFNTPEVRDQWQSVNETIGKCKIINETNGLLITRGRKTYSELLNILKGGNPQEDVYTSRGNRSNGQSSCTFTKA